MTSTYYNHKVGASQTLTRHHERGTGQVETVLLPALRRAILRAGLDPETITVQGWFRHDSWADVGGLVFTSDEPERLAAWLRRWCDRQYEKSAGPGQPRRCNDWNSYYCLGDVTVNSEGVWLKTSSYNIGD